MPPNIRHGRVNVAPGMGVVLLPGELSQQVETVQLMEHFDGGAVADAARLGVGDLQGVGGEPEALNFFVGYHHVADCGVLALLFGGRV